MAFTGQQRAKPGAQKVLMRTLQQPLPGLTRIQRPSRAAHDVEQVRACWNRTERFFDALKAGALATVSAAYAETATLDHPVAGTLTVDEIRKAWALFFRKTPAFDFTFNLCEAGATFAEVEWTMSHIFFETGRRIDMAGSSRLEFLDGRIVRQRDSFNLREWSRQALGWKGWVLSLVPGWNRFLHREARRMLGLQLPASH